MQSAGELCEGLVHDQSCVEKMLISEEVGRKGRAVQEQWQTKAGGGTSFQHQAVTALYQQKNAIFLLSDFLCRCPWALLEPFLFLKVVGLSCPRFLDSWYLFFPV